VTVAHISSPNSKFVSTERVFEALTCDSVLADLINWRTSTFAAFEDDVLLFIVLSIDLELLLDIIFFGMPFYAI